MALLADRLDPDRREGDTIISGGVTEELVAIAATPNGRDAWRESPVPAGTSYAGHFASKTAAEASVAGDSSNSGRWVTWGSSKIMHWEDSAWVDGFMLFSAFLPTWTEWESYRARFNDGSGSPVAVYDETSDAARTFGWNGTAWEETTDSQSFYWVDASNRLFDSENLLPTTDNNLHHAIVRSPYSGGYWNAGRLIEFASSAGTNSTSKGMVMYGTSSNQSVSANQSILFPAEIESIGSIDGVSKSGSTITLSAGTQAKLYASFSVTTSEDHIEYAWVSGSSRLGRSGMANSYQASSYSDSPAIHLASPTVDTDYFLRAVNVFGSPQISGGTMTILVETI